LSASRRADAVAVVVLRDRGEGTRVLLIRRARGAFAGAWTFVMGLVEADERATDAALRELGEETGLVCERFYTAGELDTFYDPVKDRIVQVPYFVARVADGEVVLDDAHEAFRWTTFAQAEELLEFAAQRRILDEIRRAFVEREPSAWRTIALP
jgi:dihydroneopterin triphosphate diphosphatase